MDDGSKKTNAKAYYFCTDSFTEGDLEILRGEFSRNWGIEVSYHRTEKGNLRIYIPTKYNAVFIELVREHIVDSFKYKLHLAT